MANGAGRRSKKVSENFGFCYCNTRNRVGCPCCCSKNTVQYKNVGAFAVACLTSLRSSSCVQVSVSLPYILTFLQLITNLPLLALHPYFQLIINLRQLALHPYVPPIDHKPPSACLTSLRFSNWLQTSVSLSYIPIRSSNWLQTSVSLPYILTFLQLITNLRQLALHP